MSWSENLATATIEKRQTGLGTSSRVVKVIPRRAGSISSLYGAKSNLKAKKNSVCNLEKKKRITNGPTGKNAEDGMPAIQWLILGSS